MILSAVGQVLFALLIAIAVAAFLRVVPRLPFGRPLVLETGFAG